MASRRSRADSDADGHGIMNSLSTRSTVVLNPDCARFDPSLSRSASSDAASRRNLMSSQFRFSQFVKRTYVHLARDVIREASPARGVALNNSLLRIHFERRNVRTKAVSPARNAGIPCVLRAAFVRKLMISHLKRNHPRTRDFFLSPPPLPSPPPVIHQE